MNKSRLEAFTDAIAAIAATIMVLELNIPVANVWIGLSAARDSSTRTFDRVFMYAGYALCMALAFIWPRGSLYLIGVIAVVLTARIFTAKE